MSYNIDTFKVKRLEDLSFPVDALYLNPHKDWHPDQEENEDDSTTFTNMGTGIRGNVKDGRFFVDQIECSGEGSGTVMNNMLEPAFSKSLGHLVASCVWEGGDSINQLEVHDGKVSWIDIKI